MNTTKSKIKFDLVLFSCILFSVKEKVIIKFGLPTGSLNKQGRGDTESVLKRAGFDVRGYAPDSRVYKPEFKNHPNIIPVPLRPQRAPDELLKGNVDIAIFGNDWAMEWTYRGTDINKYLLCDLGYGKVKMVFMVPADSEYLNLEDFIEKKCKKGEEISCYTEYIYTASAHISSTKAYKKYFGLKKPVIEIKGERIWGDNDKVKIVFSEGDTESTVWAGFTDLAFDNTQTGTTIAQYGLRILEEKGTSSACLYMSPSASKHPQKLEEIMLIKSKLEGVALAQNYKYIVFNVENKNLPPLLKELKKRKLFAHELVPRKGEKYSEVSLEIPISSYPELDYILKKFNVKDVITLSPERLIPDYEISERTHNNS